MVVKRFYLDLCKDFGMRTTGQSISNLNFVTFNFFRRVDVDYTHHIDLQRITTDNKSVAHDVANPLEDFLYVAFT